MRDTEGRYRDEQGRILVGRWPAVRATLTAALCGIALGMFVAAAGTSPFQVNCQYKVEAPTCTFVSLDDAQEQTGYFYNGREWRAVANGRDLGPSMDCGGSRVEGLIVKAPRYESRTLVGDKPCSGFGDCNYRTAGSMTYPVNFTDAGTVNDYANACVCRAIHPSEELYNIGTGVGVSEAP